MISSVLFPQASQPSMNFNISELVYLRRSLWSGLSAGSFLEQRLVMEPNRNADISKLGCASVLNPFVGV